MIALSSASSLSADHLVIGGGPSGSMVALRLAAAGRHVTLIEKERQPHHKVCGEFLSQEAVTYLHQVGISPRELGAVDLRSVRLSSGSKAVEAPLPFQALSLSRRVLDAALLDRVREKGCRVLCGVSVNSLAPGSGSSIADHKIDREWIASLSSGESLRSPSVFLSTGKHDLRGFRRPTGKHSGLIGFKLHWQLAPQQIIDLRGRMELFLFAGGYGGLSMVENNVANLCLVVRQARLRAVGGWPELLSSILDRNRHLRRLLHGAAPLWPHPLAISSIPYGYLAPTQHSLWRVGDQAAVIPSFTGDGISIALHSASLAAEMFLSGSSVAQFNSTLHAHLHRSMALATLLSRAAVNPLGRGSALTLLSLFPSAIRTIAAATRIPAYALPRDADFPTGPGTPVRQNA